MTSRSSQNGATTALGAVVDGKTPFVNVALVVAVLNVMNPFDDILNSVRLVPK